MNKQLLICLFWFGFASVADAYWINWVPESFDYYAELTRSASPESAAEKRCDVQYQGGAPLSDFWYLFTDNNGYPVFAFYCGSGGVSHNTVRWVSCDLEGHAYNETSDTCIPVEQHCGEGGYEYISGRCVNRNLGTSYCKIKPLVGNPIDAGTGNKIQREVDIHMPDSPLLRFERTYNSFGYQNSVSALGPKWKSSFDTKVYYQALWGHWRALLERADGTMVWFDKRGEGMAGPTGFPGELQYLSDGAGGVAGWVFKDTAGNTEEFDTQGLLTTRTNAAGDRIDLHYNASGRLEQVVDRFGRSLSFAYDVEGRLESVTSPDLKMFRFGYDAAGNLAQVRQPDNTPLDDTDNPSRVYLYEDARFPSHLTGITNENGERYATWSYDDRGRGISSEHAGGIDNYFLMFNADGTTTVTDDRNHARTYSLISEYGITKIASMTGGDCSGCSGDVASYTYDVYGYIETKTDFNGNVTRYVRDDFGRELSRTEAEGTPQARVITTAWDTSINKPLEITEPGRITTFTYDTQGRLESRVVQSQP